VIRRVDEISVRDRLVVEAAKRLKRRSGALRRVEPERLHRLAPEEAGGGDDLGQRHAALSAPPVYANLDHRVASACSSPGGRTARLRRPVTS
jgi:hypothetical protein